MVKLLPCIFSASILVPFAGVNIEFMGALRALLIKIVGLWGDGRLRDGWVGYNLDYRDR